MMQIYILTYCQNPETLYGNLLTFKTIRVGFPDAEINVFDNNSTPLARGAIEKACKNCGAEFHQIDTTIKHEYFIETAILNQKHGQAIFIDPDICFCGRMEDFEFDGIMAGRLIPSFNDPFFKTFTHERIHTSLLWFNDIARFKNIVGEIIKEFPQFNPLKPFMFQIDGVWHRFDTASNLYNVIKQKCYPFRTEELDLYDHLFCGTHFSNLSDRLNNELRNKIIEIHDNVKSDYRSLRGSWKIQDELFFSLQRT